MTEKFKLKIIEAVKRKRKQFSSDTKMAAFIGISRTAYSKVFNSGEINGMLSHTTWSAIAKKLEVHKMGESRIIVAKTPTFNFITKQLEACQRDSISLIMCDDAGIGKTYTAKYYVRHHKNAVYIDCSQAKSKMRLLKQIAREFGMQSNGSYTTIYDDLALYVQSLDSPLVILDEAGDLDYPAFLELKALWNATEHYCGWYMMGADGLKAKMERNLQNAKVGFTEIFRRYGERYQKVSPNGTEDSERFRMEQFSSVAIANGVKKEQLQKLYTITEGSLSRLYIEIKKMKNRNDDQA